jgi:hypothetical protein
MEERLREVLVEKDKITVVFRQLVHPLMEYKELKRVIILRG